MANYEANFDLIFDFTTNNLVVRSTTDYSSYNVYPDSSFLVFVLNIKSPDGTDIYSKDPLLMPPDYNEGIGQAEIVQIAKYEDGSLQKGSYIVDLYVIGGGHTFTKKKNFTFIGYDAPDLNLEIKYDCITPLLTLKDKTDYKLSKYSDVEPSTIVWDHTFDSPINEVYATKDVEIDTFYSGNQVTSSVVDITYHVGDDLYFIDSINKDLEVKIVCIQDLCQVYSIVDSLHKKYINAQSLSRDTEKVRQEWVLAVALMTMIKDALICGNTERLSYLHSELIRLSGNCGCGCEEEEGVLITGYSLVENNTVTVAYASDNQGSDFDFYPNQNTNYFAIFTHNKNYKPIAIDFDGFWTKIGGSAGVGDNIENFTFDDETKTFTIVTDQGTYSVQGSKYFERDTIAQRDALIASAGEAWLIGALVSVANTTGNELNPQPRTYRYDGSNVWFEFGEGVSPSPGSSTTRDITSNLQEAVGNIEPGDTIPTGTDITAALSAIFEKIYSPTFVNPSFSLSATGSYLNKIGSSQTFFLYIDFDRGKILGDIVGGLWSPSAEQNKRAGLAIAYQIDNSSNGTSNTKQVTKTISQGINTYVGSVQYTVGPQPIKSDGSNFGSPYPQGISPDQTTTKEGVYPIYATTSNILTATEQSLVSMLTGNNIQKTLVAEGGGNKQFFDIPDAWLDSRPITKVEFYNPVSGSFDSANQLSTFTQSAVTHSIEGATIDYTRFTNNTSDRGETIIKIIF